jgi:4-hydroxy-3-methylbut-2-enyl diphosphate reductase
LDPRDGVEEVSVTDEDEYFPPPRNIRELQASIEAAATILLGAPFDERKPVDDRALAASTVLADLAG